MAGSWEWHDRQRNQYGQFCRPDGTISREPINLRLPGDVAARLREEAPRARMEMGEMVAEALRAYWAAKIDA